MPTPPRSSDERRDQRRASRAPRVAKDIAKQTALSKVAQAAEKRSIPLAGLDEAFSRPSSPAAWAKMAARTGVATGLSALGFGAMATQAEQVLHRFGYRRLAIIATVLVIVQTAAAALLLTFAVAVATETITKPLSIVASLIERIHGLGSEDDSEKMEYTPETICRAAPAPRPRFVAEASEPAPVDATEEGTPTANVPDGVEEPEAVTESEGNGYTPPASIDEKGHITPEAKSLLNHIPSGADTLQSETWLLYALSHPDSDPYASWTDFTPEYRAALKRVENVRASGTPSKRTRNSEESDDTRTYATPLEVVMQIDQETFYDAFTLTAATLTASLIMEDNGSLEADQPERELAVFGRMEELCGIG